MLRKYHSNLKKNEFCTLNELLKYMWTILVYFLTLKKKKFNIFETIKINCLGFERNLFFGIMRK